MLLGTAYGFGDAFAAVVGDDAQDRVFAFALRHRTKIDRAMIGQAELVDDDVLDPQIARSVVRQFLPQGRWHGQGSSRRLSRGSGGRAPAAPGQGPAGSARSRPACP